MHKYNSSLFLFSSSPKKPLKTLKNITNSTEISKQQKKSLNCHANKNNLTTKLTSATSLSNREIDNAILKNINYYNLYNHIRKEEATEYKQKYLNTENKQKYLNTENLTEFKNIRESKNKTKIGVENFYAEPEEQILCKKDDSGTVKSKFGALILNNTLFYKKDQKEQIYLPYKLDSIYNSSISSVTQLAAVKISKADTNFWASASYNGAVNIFYEHSLVFSYNLHNVNIVDLLISKDGNFICTGDILNNIYITKFIIDNTNTNNINNTNTNNNINNNIMYTKISLNEPIEVIIWDENFLNLIDKKGNFNKFEITSENNKITATHLESTNPVEKLKPADGQTTLNSVSIICVSNCSRFAIIGGTFCGLIIKDLRDYGKNIYIACDSVVDITSHPDTSSFLICTTAEIFTLWYSYNSGFNTGDDISNKTVSNSIKDFNRNTVYSFTLDEKFNMSLFDSFTNTNINSKKSIKKSINYKNKKNINNKNIKNINNIDFYGNWKRRNIKFYCVNENLIYLNNSKSNLDDNENYVEKVLIVGKHNVLFMKDNTVRVEHLNCVCLRDSNKYSHSNTDVVFTVFNYDITDCIVFAHPTLSLIVSARYKTEILDLYGNSVFDSEKSLEFNKNFVSNFSGEFLKENNEISAKKLAKLTKANNLKKKTQENTEIKISDVYFDKTGFNFYVSTEIGEIKKYSIFYSNSSNINVLNQFYDHKIYPEGENCGTIKVGKLTSENVLENLTAENPNFDQFGRPNGFFRPLDLKQFEREKQEELTTNIETLVKVTGNYEPKYTENFQKQLNYAGYYSKYTFTDSLSVLEILKMTDDNLVKVESKWRKYYEGFDEVQEEAQEGESIIKDENNQNEYKRTGISSRNFSELIEKYQQEEKLQIISDSDEVEIVSSEENSLNSEDFDSNISDSNNSDSNNSDSNNTTSSSEELNKLEVKPRKRAKINYTPSELPDDTFIGDDSDYTETVINTAEHPRRRRRQAAIIESDTSSEEVTVRRRQAVEPKNRRRRRRTSIIDPETSSEEVTVRRRRRG